MLTVDVIIPTYQPDEKWNRQVAGLLRQTYQPHHVLVVNTGEPLKNQERVRERFAARRIPAEFVNITPEEFDHGGTRHMAAGRCEGDLLLFMTDDAVPGDSFLIENLVKAFDRESVAAAYARQLPDQECRLIERYTRSFNYPDQSRMKTAADLEELGIKTFFCSNVCAMYRRSVYEKLGGFPVPAIFNEDMIFAGRLIQAGYGIAYAADAKVIHSHNYSFRQQFSRNFDLGVSQKQNPRVFGMAKSEGEGIRLVKKTAGFLVKNRRFDRLPALALGSGAKFLGYRLGKCYDRLPRRLVYYISMNKRYWEKQWAAEESKKIFPISGRFPESAKKSVAGGLLYKKQLYGKRSTTKGKLPAAEDVLVSVCIPAYNSGAYIERTMESVLNQTHKNLELVVVDDHSTDDTVKLVERMAAKDDRVRLEVNSKNLGLSGNWNACIRQARGTYVKLLCADDLLYPDSIEKELAPFLAYPDVHLVMSDTRLINVMGQNAGAFYRWPKKGLMDGRKLARYSLLFNNFFGAPCNNLFPKASAVRVGGFDRRFSYIPDFDFWVRMACLGQVYIIHECLNAFRVRKDSNTGEVMGEGGRGQDYVKEHAWLVKKHGRKLGLSKAACAFSVWWRKSRSRLIHVYLKIVTK